jgi:hypothetical protein
MQDAEHFVFRNFENCASVHGRCRSLAMSSFRSQGLFSEKVAWRKKRDGGLFAFLGNDKELCAAIQQTINGVRRITLSENAALGLQLHDSLTNARVHQKSGGG